MKRVTYSQLGKALASLGFEKIEQDDFTAFKNDTYDAWIVLPKGESATLIRPAHMLAVEKMVTEKGIASARTFERAIGEKRRPLTARLTRVKRVAPKTTQAASSPTIH